jgi:hypothetical protein
MILHFHKSNRMIEEKNTMRCYYSSRSKPKRLSTGELYQKLESLYLLFRDKDYFKNKAGITKEHLPDPMLHEAVISLNFQPFPITKWTQEKITEDHIFDTLEFLYDYVSKPGEWVEMTNETGWNYYDYDSYDDEAGKVEFRGKANGILTEYKNGFELTKEGIILALVTGGLQHILDAEIIPYDEFNVDRKVQHAITKWRNRHLSISEQQEAIRELADVFEWLKKTKNLDNVLNNKDEAALFDIANNFAIRHHNPNQKSNYDRTIWYAWIFHFYLAAYHASIRLLIRKENKTIQQLDED